MNAKIKAIFALKISELNILTSPVAPIGLPAESWDNCADNFERIVPIILFIANINPKIHEKIIPVVKYFLKFLVIADSSLLNQF